MPLDFIQNDITKIPVDAIVNAANPALQQGSGVCGAIFRAAGAQKLQEACDRIGGCQTGEAVITPGFDLVAKYIIHTVGPVWQGGNAKEETKLYNCYRNALELAKSQKLESIVFPLISAGIYGYPKESALKVAVCAIDEFLQQNDMDVYLVFYERESLVIGEERYCSIHDFLEESLKSAERPNLGNFASRLQSFSDLNKGEFSVVRSYRQASLLSADRNLRDIAGRLEESFSTALLRLIDEKGKTDVEVYKRANVDKRLFSKIRSEENYKPSKATAVAFAIALELNLYETADLLKKAGYALSHSNLSDLIVEYFIGQGHYNIYEINEALFTFDQPTIGF